jgi:ActR/RegA family two-component response regulator
LPRNGVGKVVSVPIRCLLVDDSDEFLRSAARLLESSGFEIVGLAHTSAEALELAAAHEPDLALVDVELGSEDGMVLADKLAALAPSTRIILSSSYDEVLGDAIASGSAVAFVPKSRLTPAVIAALL